MNNESMKIGLSKGDFNSYSVKTFQGLFEDHNFTDVTLVCEDQRQIKGHKVALCAGSRFFKEILLRNPHPDPLLYLKVPHYSLYSIMKFIYLGQCEVEQYDIEPFLETVKDLKIEGLSSETEIELPIPTPNKGEKDSQTVVEKTQAIKRKDLPDCEVQSKEDTMKEENVDDEKFGNEDTL